MYQPQSMSRPKKFWWHHNRSQKSGYSKTIRKTCSYDKYNQYNSWSEGFLFKWLFFKVKGYLWNYVLHTVHFYVSLRILTEKLNISDLWCSSFLGDTWRILIIKTNKGNFSFLENLSIDYIKDRKVLDFRNMNFKLRYMDTTSSHSHTFQLYNRIQELFITFTTLVIMK